MTSLVTLTAEQLELADRARRFVEEELLPREVQAEKAGGRLPDEIVADIRAAGVKARLNGGRISPAYGGQGWSATDYVAVHEQLGRSTNGLWWWIPDAYNVLTAGTPEQIQRYLVPCVAGTAAVSYAVTEEHAGSDPSGIATTAVKVDGGWVIDGEKWFVTSGDVATTHVVVAVTEEGPTLFLVPADAEGVETVDDPPFTHSFPHGHPAIRFTGVRVNDEDVLGPVGGADALQQRWFVEERLGIAVHCVAAMGRLLEEAVEWAAGREQGGSRILDHQGVSFPLADSAADAAAARPPRTPAAGPRSPTPGPTPRSSTPRPRWRSSSPARRPTAAPTACSRCSAAAATSAPSPPSASGGSCGSTGSGRAPARSSGW
jgi:acyl-CoA dehydrogenase